MNANYIQLPTFIFTMYKYVHGDLLILALLTTQQHRQSIQTNATEVATKLIEQWVHCPQLARGSASKLQLYIHHNYLVFQHSIDNSIII